MSNRLIAILLLFFLGIAGFFYWTFVIVPNEQQVKNEENLVEESQSIDLVKIEVEAEELTLDDSVELEVLEENQNVEQNQDVEENNENSVGQNTGNNETRIQELKENLSNYKNINLGNDKFAFKILDNNLGLYLNSKFVSTFSLVPENLLEIQKVYYALGGEYYILVGNKKYLYIKNTDTIKEFELNVSINYIKKIDGEYLINTTKGTFLLDRQNTVEYVDIFEDFVYYNESYVGILRNTDTRRLNNLGFTLSKNNAIVYYNPTTKETKILYETNLNLTKIYFNTTTEIYFEENGNNTYKLQNFN